MMGGIHLYRLDILEFYPIFILYLFHLMNV